MQLNQPQHDAVTNTDGPLLVFAGAGSGKTRVITYRIANLLTQGVAPQRILAVTFTNKAAAEMKDRLRKLAGDLLVNELGVGTFHSTCCRILRRCAPEVGLGRNFVIYDDGDQKALMTRVIRRAGYSEEDLPAKKVLAVIGRHKQEGRTPDDVARNPDGAQEETVNLFRDFEKALLACNAVDFDNLILHVLRVVEDPNSPAGQELRRRYQYVLVDEFQDTNSVQYRLVRALAANTGNLCVVGDDDQSIYSWRGADIRNIRGFKTDFAGAKIVKLEQNYRSSGNIVAAALGVIREAPNREEKELWTSAEAGDKVRVHVSRDERDEAAWVISNLQAELARGVPADELAVFYRINAQSRVFEEAFRASKVPYQIIGGMRFFERAEVKDVMSYLRLLENPASDADFLRIINTPARGIGDRSVEQLVACSSRNQTNLWSALPFALEDGSLPAAACKKFAAFHELMSTLQADAARLSPAHLAEEVLLRTGYSKMLKAADTPESDARAENIAELIGSLQEFELDCEAAGDVPTLAAYLERVSLVADIDASTGGKSVLLMTVHSAKGLEFESVYLTGMEEEVFPYRGLDGKSSEELAEERRLAYVAVTRARKRLQISYAGARTLFGKTRYLAPSRFLADLPREVCEHDGRPSAVGSYSTQSSYGRNYGGTSATTGTPRYGTNSDRGYGGYRAPRKYDEFDQSVPEDVSAGAATDFDVTDGATFENLPMLRVNAMRPGMRVAHARFGLGTLRSVSPGEPAKVIATFPGWGEKKILADSIRGVR